MPCLIAKDNFKQARGFRVTYDVLIETDVLSTTKQKWINVLNLTNFNWKKKYLY